MVGDGGDQGNERSVVEHRRDDVDIRQMGPAGERLRPAGELETRLQTKMSADETEGVVHLDVFVRAQIEDLDAMFGLAGEPPIHDVEHGGQAVLHVEIGFPLRAIAEHF